MPEIVWIRFGSHRAREKALSAVPEMREKGHFSFRRETGRGAYPWPAERLADLERIKGWTRLRGPFNDLMKCWRWT